VKKRKGADETCRCPNCGEVHTVGYSERKEYEAFLAGAREREKEQSARIRQLEDERGKERGAGLEQSLELERATNRIDALLAALVNLQAQKVYFERQAKLFKKDEVALAV
jgi:uncharacterized Zn finger protein (UPF0148 family)